MVYVTTVLAFSFFQIHVKKANSGCVIFVSCIFVSEVIHFDGIMT